ncbi:MAG: hypothetical protein L3K11_07560 [Thermoplasmata archaeon]|nr:hypothetical protein [Thermoplasmata archaeon]
MTGEWLKAQGLGRERFAAHLQSYLEEIGYRVESVDREGTTDVRAELRKPNPSVPASMRELRFRLNPTSGGASLTWTEPAVVDAGELARADRLGREIEQQLVRVALTESHGTVKLRPAVGARWPWRAAPASRAAPVVDGGPAPL